jgi:hypothetical protein
MRHILVVIDCKDDYVFVMQLQTTRLAAGLAA